MLGDRLKLENEELDILYKRTEEYRPQIAAPVTALVL